MSATNLPIGEGGTISNAEDAQRVPSAKPALADCARQTTPKGALCTKLRIGGKSPRHSLSLASLSFICKGSCATSTDSIFECRWLRTANDTKCHLHQRWRNGNCPLATPSKEFLYQRFSAWGLRRGAAGSPSQNKPRLSQGEGWGRGGREKLRRVCWFSLPPLNKNLHTNIPSGDEFSN